MSGYGDNDNQSGGYGNDSQQQGSGYGGNSNTRSSGEYIVR